ncbi:hypothetical protein ACSBR1_013448 [Camellia fascicularis]
MFFHNLSFSCFAFLKCFAGYEAPNLRKLADKVAAEGFLVVVLDFFYGEPFDLNNPNMDRESWRKAHGVISFWFHYPLSKSRSSKLAC